MDVVDDVIFLEDNFVDCAGKGSRSELVRIENDCSTGLGVVVVVIVLIFTM